MLSRIKQTFKKFSPISLQTINKPIYIDFPLKRYYTSHVRPEFANPISLHDLKNIDYKPGHHYKPKTISDTLSYSIVKFLRFFADTYFKEDYTRRAICLETVAAIPGLVGGMYRHLYSLRNMTDNGEAIHKLLLEAENERQHLLTFLEVGKPGIFDRLVVRAIQPVFFAFYMVFYGVFPKMAHRFVGYLEEEAIRSYDAYERHIALGDIENIDAPLISKKYWKLPDNAKLIDVVRAVRADEAAHRDANHGMADVKPFKLG
ncbi:inducible alternative oxidase 2 [Conglomerata obtusa]